MKFDIFGRQILEVIRKDNVWEAFYCGDTGVKRKAHDILIPSSLREDELAAYIADIFHESATPEKNEVKRI